MRIQIKSKKKNNSLKLGRKITLCMINASILRTFSRIDFAIMHVSSMNCNMPYQVFSSRIVAKAELQTQTFLLTQQTVCTH